MDSIYDIEKCREIRKKIFCTAYRGGIAHLASAFSCVEILYTLYLKGIMKYDIFDLNFPERDRFILSKGHGGLALYVVMAEAGLMPEEDLMTFLQPGTHIGGEPCMRDMKGIEASTGSLGHGLSMAVGMAMANKMDGRDSKTYVLLGDGECEEGVIWEAATSAVTFRLDNLVAILDCNSIQKLKTVEDTIGYVDWNKRWRSFGWEVIEVDGHDIEALHHVLSAENQTGKPRLVIAKTIKGKGVSIMENDPKWHYRMPKKKELKIFLKELCIKEGEFA